MHVTTFDNLNQPAILLTRPDDKGAGVSAIGPDASQPIETPAHALEDTTSAVTVLNIARMHHHCQDQTERVHENMAFTAFDLLAGVVTTMPPFSVLTVWLSRIAALGVGLRPALRRTCSRRRS